MSVYRALDWHEGEHEVHRLTKVDRTDNPTHPGLTGWLSQRISVSPTIALGTVDDKNNVWCTLWGGELPIAQQVAPGGVVGIRTNVDASFDPVVQILYEGHDDGEVVRGTPQDGKMISGLSIKLEERDRVKFFGRMLAGSLSAEDTAENKTGAVGTGKTGNAQLVMQIQQSLGNCPKYLNKKTIFPIPDAPKPQLVSDSPVLCQQAIDHIHQADLFFVASRGPEDDMDCNHRGGKPGFVRVLQPDDSTASEDGEHGTVLVWPEYSGNNLYQTLGNIYSTHTVGVVIPNFESGDVLYVTGHADVLLDHEAISMISKTRLAVKLIVKEARFVRNGLTFRGKPIDDAAQGFSPYNPKIRYLTTERPLHDYEKGALPPVENRRREHADVTAEIIDKQQLTPTIFRYRFKMSDNYAEEFPKDDAGLVYKAGQYVALDFSDELFMGYSHMNDGDPTSLNDDYLRTFTVSSSPRSKNVGKDEFEMVIRKVGTVTNWMSWQRPDRVHVRVGVKGFAGDFQFDNSKESVFIAAGIGITPLLGQLDQINEKMKILWTVGIKDIGLVEDALKICTDEVKKNMTIFLTGGEDSLTEEEVAKLEPAKADANLGKLERRRMQQEDVTSLEQGGDIANWYLCTAPAFRKTVQDWVPSKVLVFENFDY